MLLKSAGMLESGVSCPHDSDEGPRVSKNRTVGDQYDSETLAGPGMCVMLSEQTFKGYRKECQAGHAEVQRAVSLSSRKSKELRMGNAWEKRQGVG